jgi:hypothetical protein
MTNDKHILNKKGAVSGHEPPTAWKVHTIPVTNHTNQAKLTTLLDKKW